LNKGLSKIKKSVKSFNPKKSVIQTNYDIVKAHGGDPDSYREKVENKKGEGAEFIIQLPIKINS
jgi:hypothetical protein